MRIFNLNFAFPCIFSIFLTILNYFTYAENYCYKDVDNCEDISNFRYLFYDVNPQEGFNLRRDVYMRFAVLAHQLQKSKNSNLSSFKLVLPPWSHLIHWGYHDTPEYIPWGRYFDITSMQDFAPVIEMHQFFSGYNKYSKINIDEVYTLQHFKDMFETGNFEDRMKIEECAKQYAHYFLFYKNITSTTFHCLSYHGAATKLTNLFLNTTAKTIFIEHAEVALHDSYGSKVYWQARRSMRFNKELKALANEFRKLHLNSEDETDKTLLPENWRDEKPKRDAIGGPYIAVHLRRRDFVRYRPNDAPPINVLAKQIEIVLKKLKLTTVFVATDGSTQEIDELVNTLPNYHLKQYNPSNTIREKYGRGGIAILDQIICSHARYFIGTHESTFSFRIQEEREILGFPVDTTFNIFCNKNNCEEPSVWKIVH